MIKVINNNIDSLACVRVKGGESEWFRIDIGVKQGCYIPWLFNVYMDGVMKEVKMEMERRGGSRDYMASCMQMTWFCAVSRRRIDRMVY